MRSFLCVSVIIICAVITVSAQTDRDLKLFFEGSNVTLRIDMPASKDGVNVYPERSQQLDYSEYAKRLKRHGISVRRGETIMVTKVKIKDKHIEFQLGGGVYGTVGDETDSSVRVEHKAVQRGSRFNVHFTRMDSLALTPSALIDALTRYVEFEGAADGVSSLRQGVGFVRHGVVHVGPRTTYLKEGLKTQEVFRLLGAPSAGSERIDEGAVVTTYEFSRSEGRTIVAEFVGDALVRSRTESRAASAILKNSAPSGSRALNYQ